VEDGEAPVLPVLLLLFVEEDDKADEANRAKGETAAAVLDSVLPGWLGWLSSAAVAAAAAARAAAAASNSILPAAGARSDGAEAPLPPPPLLPLPRADLRVFGLLILVVDVIFVYS
jgi:hypothetical protein